MRQLSSRTVYSNAWLTLREDEVELADGRSGVYAVVDKPDFAVVVPRDGDGFWMVEQHRYPVGRRTLEFPMGGWPAGRSGPLADLARAELREETGLRAGRLTRLGHLSTANGFSSQGFDVFLAEELTAGPTDREPTEADMVHRLVPRAELAELVRSGAVDDATTVAAYALLLVTEATGAGR
ncbi:NUDIX domain-containing protein [Modestobacter versicolor]|uniref:8-oxo-dGTP pyrophosphatase MutT (NUDIX family) n=1 Tax=Modestobacter versicolor TaxID=429133 RepID=A0A323V5F6_9ACTN|nr:NUDIX hydrolase [Modestobacter versicolor]MBB3676363.1 8-oxo-dGTP pyrophosphatase MutT (NUDIX family) [Modestobacter versicolor]PZA19962.1 ADP-ribose pyrophosphatase [Modestobacter versicolor]